MNRLKSSLAAKISAIFLFVITLVLLVLCTAGIIYMADSNVYYDEGKSAREDIIYSYLYSEVHTAVELYEDSLNDEYFYHGYESFEKKYNRENTNLSLLIKDKDDKVLFSNYKANNLKYDVDTTFTILLNRRYESKTKSFESYQERWSYIEECEDKYQDLEYGTYDEDTDGDEDYECVLEMSYVTGDATDINVYAGIDNNINAKDDLYYQLMWFDKLTDLRYPIIIVAALAFIICVVTFIFLLCAVGHKNGREGIHLNWVDRIPLDLYGAIIGLLVLCEIAVLNDIIAFASISNIVVEIAVIAVLMIGVIILGLALILTFATRAKYGAWWKNTIIYRVLKLIFKVIKMVISAIPVMPKVIIALVVICIVNYILAVSYPYEGSFILWFIECCLLVPCAILIVLQLKRLRKGIENIADGDFKSQIDTKNLIPELRACGASINSINNVLSREVNERMKSERFKTELITNVSHDIKTPLTSIINYVDIIKKKDIEDKELNDYIEVLDRQSNRLKKLIEDLVECSKAQTGNIAVNKTPLDIGVLLTQTVGEYQEKLEANNLSLVVQKPEEPVFVMADGRLLWRAVENLLNNACKYSLTGTRVYLSLESNGNEAVVILKNVSKEQLNVSSDELMERFVRGDSSRNTEGSGLGLSIAKSLLELQQAKMELEIDGDLFKVMLKFKLIGKEYVNA